MGLEDIVYDYMLTRECNRKRFELIHQNYHEVDMGIVIPDEIYERISEAFSGRGELF